MTRLFNTKISKDSIKQINTLEFHININPQDTSLVFLITFTILKPIALLSVEKLTFRYIDSQYKLLDDVFVKVDTDEFELFYDTTLDSVLIRIP